jgi:high-affinity nickel-transport protein
MIVAPALSAPLLLGFALGLRHAFDADHVAAMGTIVARERSVRRAALLGAVWGLGHSISLFIASAVVILARVPFPPALAHWLELAVAAMLIVLGAQSLVTDLRRRVADRHGRTAADPGEGEATAARRRPFFIGLVHGLAGSGGLALLVLPSLPNPAAALAYVALFGLGSVGGMALWSAALAVPVGRSARSNGAVARWVPVLSGIVSVGCGVALAAQLA